MADKVKPGEQTTEHQETKRAKWVAWVLMVLGAVIAIGGQLVGIDGDVGVIAGCVVTCAGAVQETLVTLGYQRTRADVKKAASDADAVKGAVSQQGGKELLE
jgi:hypothetical protein